jgi:hypothetical protein
MDILTVLRDWHNAKLQIDALEEKISKYRVAVAREMNKQDVNKFTVGNYTVSRRRTTKSHITKANVPVDIWNRYATSSSFDAFYLKRKC